MKPFIVKKLFIACINFKTYTCSLETKDCLSNITGEIPKFQKFTEEHQQFKISLGETQITNTHRRGRKSKPFLLGTDFIGLIFTGELRQGILFICNQKYRKAVLYKIAVKVVLLGIAVFKICLLL